jgi:hypothetical protein
MSSFALELLYISGFPSGPVPIAYCSLCECPRWQVCILRSSCPQNSCTLIIQIHNMGNYVKDLGYLEDSHHLSRESPPQNRGP